MSRLPRQRKQKLAKDAPIFQCGKPRGEVRYPPCEGRDDELASLHRDFRIHPFGNIAEYPRHIPYNSDKKSFQERTARGSFEVFQYTFQLPGEDKQWTVMWDYNIGLVRITHLFKCNDYSKTTPAKMLNQNPGLRDICHSITGGALAAQGYWMPYEAAKAVASTFCWKIRFALTPIFGTDFPNTCIPPNDRSRFGRMIIDASVVRTATEKADYYRMLELQRLPTDSLRAEYLQRPSSAPGIDTKRAPLGRSILPKHHQHHRSNTLTSTDTSVMGYGSSPEMDYYSSGTEPYCVSPVSPIRRGFTPVNTLRSTDVYPPAPPSSSGGDLPSAHEILASAYTGLRSRAKERAKARALAQARGRVIPTSVPYTPSMAPANRTSYSASTTSTPSAEPEGSDIDGEAETDIEFFDVDGEYEFESNSSDESTPSTSSSSSDDSNEMNVRRDTGVVMHRLPRLPPSRYPGREADIDSSSPRDTDGDGDTAMYDVRARTSKRVTAASVVTRKRDRRAYPYPQPYIYPQTQYDRDFGPSLERDRSIRRGGCEESLRTHAHTPSPPDHALRREIAAAQALISMMDNRVARGRSSSDVDGGHGGHFGRCDEGNFLAPRSVYGHSDVYCQPQESHYERQQEARQVCLPMQNRVKPEIKSETQIAPPSVAWADHDHGHSKVHAREAKPAPLYGHHLLPKSNRFASAGRTQKRERRAST
ncbi:putative APSES transcription factor Xbp1 [Aspergillus stella-maris]|uniref:putative APSES transcription factor Xbp1 n=1 Tax=Aspergillus stella-maris TaxID=1810926 RepID=UPI003CCCE349